MQQSQLPHPLEHRIDERVHQAESERQQHDGVPDPDSHVGVFRHRRGRRLQRPPARDVVLRQRAFELSQELGFGVRVSIGPHGHFRHAIDLEQPLQCGTAGESKDLLQPGTLGIVDTGNTHPRFACGVVGTLSHHHDAFARPGFELAGKLRTDHNAGIVGRRERLSIDGHLTEK